MNNKVFLDTGFTIALSVEADSYHEKALGLAEVLEANETQIVTTRAVLLETGNALSKIRYRSAAIELIDAIENDPLIEIVPFSDELFAKAFDLFRTRSDKEWGLIDCVSFTVMRENQISDALTSDKHYEQAGFNAMLLGKN